MKSEQVNQGSGASDSKPIVVVSQCLGFAAVRYNGAMLRDDFVRALGNHVRFAQVCPEIGIGLGVPRDPIRLVAVKGERHLVQPATGKDVTDAMRRFSESFLDSLGPVDGFILKSRSPSCGIKDVKIFSGPEKAPVLGKDAGMFAEAVMRRCVHAAIEDEGRLTNLRLRHHFLIRLFASARFRAVRDADAMSALVKFHTDYKLQWMAYSHAGLTALGRVVANKEGLPRDQVLSAYADRMAQLLAQPSRPGPTCNALQHAFGYVSEQLSAKERSYFLSLMQDYRSGRLPLSALISVLRAWVLRFEDAYLSCQRFFEPYPAELMNLADSAGTPGQAV